MAQLNLLRADVRSTLHLPPETMLLPGTNIGVLELSCKEPNFAAFDWPAVHVLLVREEVVNYLQEHKITGWEVAPVRIEGKRTPEAIPLMHQLFVTGTGGIPTTDPPVEKISHCEACGRTEFRRGTPRSFQMDPSQWDGSDIFRFGGGYHGYIFITDRLADGFRAAGFTNYELVTVERFLQRRAPYAIS